MGLGVRFLQTLDRHVRINLRRRQASVTEQRLNATQICAAIEHVRGKAVPQFVRADRDWDRSVLQVTFQDQPDRPL